MPARRQEADESFTVQSSRVAGGIMLVFRGQLDLRTAWIAEEALANAERSHEFVGLDLRHLSFMDSTGLRLIVVAEQRARASGHRLVVLAAPPIVRSLFEVTGLDKWLDVRSDSSDLTG
jgi:anti-sigma B factor antagonist